MENTNIKPSWAIIAARQMKVVGLTQDDLLNSFGVTTRGAIGHYFTGRREPTIKQLQRLAEKIGLSIAELIGGEPTEPPQVAEENPIPYKQELRNRAISAFHAAPEDMAAEIKAVSEILASVPKGRRAELLLELLSKEIASK